MYKTVSDLRDHDPLEYSERLTYEANASSSSNTFGIALIIFCVVAALILTVVVLQA